MHRTVSSRLQATLWTPVDVALAVAVHPVYGATERLSVTVDGAPVTVRELRDDHGGVLHCADRIGPGRLDVSYEAAVTGRAGPIVPEPIEPLRFRRPSRYCESDHLGPTARAEFAGLHGLALLDAVSSWVGQHLAYVSGSSRPTDGAVNTLLARRGVCRDFAHLCIAMLRANDVPARLVSVYAPGLDPMDFHAVAEALIDGRWLAIDATTLAPRSSLLRIATGRDASDTAFLTTAGGVADLTAIEVSAVCDHLPDDDLTEVVALG
jgi:transglutaminase-like putative cysteine protease